MKFLPLLLLLLLCSCSDFHFSLAKRHYRNGFYFRTGTSDQHTAPDNRDESAVATKDNSAAEEIIPVESAIDTTSCADTTADHSTIAARINSDTLSQDDTHETAVPRQAQDRLIGRIASADKNEFWWNLFGAFLLLIACAVIPCAVIGGLGYMGLYSQKEWFEKLGNPLLILAMLALLAEIVALILLMGTSPLWLPIYLPAVAIALICMPFVLIYIVRDGSK